MSRATCAAIALLGVACSSAPAREDREPEPTTAGAEARFGFEEAIAAVRALVPGALLIEVEHERVDGVELVEVELIDGDGVHEMFFDPSSGELVREGEETLSDEERAALPSLRRAIADHRGLLETAVALARLRHADAELREVELMWVDGELVLEVEVDLDGAAQSHRYPAPDEETDEEAETDGEAGTDEEGPDAPAPVQERAMEEEELYE